MQPKWLGIAAGVVVLGGAAAVWAVFAGPPRTAPPAVPEPVPSVPDRPPAGPRAVGEASAHATRASADASIPATEARAPTEPAGPRSAEPVFAVRVVDTSDRPLVGLAVRAIAGERSAEQPTDDDGWVRFAARDIVETSEARVWVEVRIGRGPEGPISGAWIESDREHTFRLPGIAHVEVAVLNARAGARVGLGAVGQQRGYRADDASLDGVHAVAPAPGEVARFTVLASSGWLEAYLVQPGDLVAPTAMLRAPDAGEAARVVLDGSDVPVRLVGRAVDERGRPLAHAALAAQLNIASGRTRPPYWHHDDVPPYLRRIEGLRTDAEGGFSIGLAPGWAGREPAVLLASGERTARALPDRLVEGTNDLGVVAFGPAPLAAAGVVVDRGGAPVAGAGVVIYAEEERHGIFDGTRYDARSGADGSFLVRGEPLYGGVRLGVRAVGFHDVEIDLGGPPRADHRIVLEHETSLLGRVALPPHAEPAGLRVSLVRERDGDSSERWGPVEPDGSFAFTGLVSGPVRFALADGAGRALFEAEYDLAPGENRPAALDPLALDTPLATLRFAFHDERGGVPEGLAVRLAPRAEAGDARLDAMVHRFHGHGGERAVTAAPGSFDLLAFAPGYAAEVRRAPTRDQTIGMTLAPTVALRLEPPLHPLPRGLRLDVQTTVSAPALSLSDAPVAFEGGTATVPVPVRGAYRFHLQLLDDLGEGGGASPALGVPLQLDPAALPPVLQVTPSEWLRGRVDATRRERGD